eukprot:3216314-Pleurochrysis_carterae.AAC.2
MRWRWRWYRTYSAHSCAYDASVSPLDAASRTEPRASGQNSAWHMRRVSRFVGPIRTMELGHPGRVLPWTVRIQSSVYAGNKTPSKSLS